MQILTTPNDFLKHKAKEIKTWDKKTIKEVKEMIEILKKAHDPKGVGLAAVQVGLDKSFFILYNEEKDETKIYVNPKVIESSQKMLSDVYTKKKDRWLEGCLSVPKIWGFVDRPYSITLQYEVPENPKIENCKLKIVRESFSDIEASYTQHEIDHLSGILFTDRIREQNGQMFRETEDGLTPIHL